jgi:hypothetical protein
MMMVTRVNFSWRSPVGARKEEECTEEAECFLEDSVLGE